MGHDQFIELVLKRSSGSSNGTDRATADGLTASHHNSAPTRSNLHPHNNPPLPLVSGSRAVNFVNPLPDNLSSSRNQAGTQPQQPVHHQHHSAPTIHLPPQLPRFPLSTQIVAAMASPAPADSANGVSTPPSQAQASPQPTQTSASAENAPPAPSAALPAAQATSLKDDGLSTKRPRDARLIHLLLAAQGVSAYQERVPLMIMDFAYRYTSGILSDAFQLTQDGYGLPSTERGRDKDQATVSMQHLRLAMSARQHYQFQPSLPKEVLLEMAQERNKVVLPKPERDFGVRLPPEKYTFTGTGWGLKQEWDSETEGEEEVVAPVQDEQMKDVDGGLAEDEDIDNDEFESVMGTGADGGGDSTMADA